MLEKCLENFNLTILFSVKPSITIVFPLFNFTWKTLKQEIEGIEIICFPLLSSLTYQRKRGFALVSIGHPLRPN